MKLITNIIFIGLFCFIGQLFFPWWIVIIVTFLIGFLRKGKSSQAFISGFIGVGLLWLSYATYLDVGNGQRLTTAIAEVMSLNPSFFLIMVTTFLGAVHGALGAWTGNLLRKLFEFI
ncbi:MAG: hypothetical protein EA412_10440 [Chitinophagaceae bacterium]|nr:MAG: hypothetical protein EA412_10440 [Chitinophagaceae bacterium]